MLWSSDMNLAELFSDEELFAGRAIIRAVSLSDGSQSIVVDSALCNVPPSASTFGREKYS